MIRALATVLVCAGCSFAVAAERAAVIDSCGSAEWACGDPYVPDLIDGLRDLGAVAVYARYGGDMAGVRTYAVALIPESAVRWRAWLILRPDLGDFPSRHPRSDPARASARDYVQQLERSERLLPAKLGQRVQSAWEASLARLRGSYAGSPGLDGYMTTFATATYSVSAWDLPHALLTELAAIADALSALIQNKPGATRFERLKKIEHIVARVEDGLKSNKY